MYKRILVAIDGSDISDLALQESVKLAKECGAVLRVIIVVDAFNMTPQVEFIPAKDMLLSMEKEATHILDRAKKTIDSSGILAEFKMLETDSFGHRIPEVIVQDAQVWPAELIVIATHGRRGFSHFLLGSVAEAIVRIATKPVLLIRGKEALEKNKKT